MNLISYKYIVFKRWILKKTKKTSDFNNLDFQEVRMKKIKSEVKRFMVENNMSKMNDIIDYLIVETGYSESIIHDSIYRRKKVTGSYLAKLESALGLKKGELVLINDDLKTQHPLHEVKRDISIFFNTLDLIDVLYLVEYFDYYIGMSSLTFEVLMDLSELDEMGRKLFYKRFLQLKPSINMNILLSTVSDITPLVILSEKDKKELKPKLVKLEDKAKNNRINDVDLSIRKKLWKVLEPKLDGLFYDDLLKFFEMSRGIYTMDSLDWDIAIGFELLDISYYQSENTERNNLIAYLKELKQVGADE